MREGQRPDGPPVDPKKMPYPVYKHMNDAELTAIYAFLTSLQPKPFGER